MILKNTTTYKKTQELSTIDLIQCIYILQKFKSKKINTIDLKIENCSFKNIDNIFKEIYKGLIIPTYIPILMLIPLLLLTSSKENLNFSKVSYITFIIGISTVIFSETTIRFITESPFQNYSISLMPFIFYFSFIFFFTKILI